MLHDAGIAVIYQVEEGAGPPPASPRLKEKTRQAFGEMTVGVTRFYSAAAAGKTVSRLIELWRTTALTPGTCAGLGSAFTSFSRWSPPPTMTACWSPA